MLIYWRVYIYNIIYIYTNSSHTENDVLFAGPCWAQVYPGILPDFCSSRRKPPSLWVLSRCPHWAPLPKAEKWRKFAALPCPARPIRCWRADSIKYQQQHVYLTIVFHVSFKLLAKINHSLTTQGLLCFFPQLFNFAPESSPIKNNCDHSLRQQRVRLQRRWHDAQSLLVTLPAPQWVFPSHLGHETPPVICRQWGPSIVKWRQRQFGGF